MNLKLKNRLALVTGSSKGIGKSIAIWLASQGARVIVVARNQESLNEVKEELQPSTRPHSAIAVDLMSNNGTATLIKRVLSEQGTPDILVHNLGGSFGFTANASVEDWKKVWYFNVGIVHELNLAFVPKMREQKWGRIVCLSTLSTKTFNGYPPYVSAKCALDGYVKSMAREWARDNVILSAVSPGAIYSEGRYFAKLKNNDPVALEEYYREHLPTYRLGTGEDIGPMVAFLCSDYAEFMAGSIVGIDGAGS